MATERVRLGETSPLVVGFSPQGPQRYLPRQHCALEAAVQAQHEHRVARASRICCEPHAPPGALPPIDCPTLCGHLPLATTNTANHHHCECDTPSGACSSRIAHRVRDLLGLETTNAKLQFNVSDVAGLEPGHRTKVDNATVERDRAGCLRKACQPWVEPPRARL